MPKQNHFPYPNDRNSNICNASELTQSLTEIQGHEIFHSNNTHTINFIISLLIKFFMFILGCQDSVL